MKCARSIDGKSLANEDKRTMAEVVTAVLAQWAIGREISK
jgi:hypothetical protein